MLQYRTDDWRFRANWGDTDLIPYGKKDTPEKKQLGDLPESGKWVRLEVDLTAFGLSPGTKITGMAFTQFDGRAWWDKAGLVTTDDPGPVLFVGNNATGVGNKVQGFKSSPLMFLDLRNVTLAN